MFLTPITINTLANYLGLIYAISLSIFIYPLYLHYLGAEALGLVGFFTLLQSWLQLLDMGLSPMLSRQIAASSGNEASLMDTKKLVRSLEIIFIGIALIVFISTLAGSQWIANEWLHIKHLSIEKVNISIILMGAILALRFISTVYRSGLQGMERQVWLNILNSLIATLRFLGALFLLIYVSQDIVDFFLYQLFVSTLELFLFLLSFYFFYPSKKKIGFRFFWASLKPSLPFAGGIAFTAGLWIVITQIDKTILSTVLSLSEFGYFAIIIAFAAGITQLSSPISQAILPRMTALLARGEKQSMLDLYRQSTQIMAMIIFPVAAMVSTYSTEVIYAWTGSQEAAKWGGDVLSWYALGNGVLAISAFQYYLQFAHGNLKMHVVYNAISAIIQIPIIIYSAINFGALGVAITWFVLRVITFILWTPIVHHKFAPGIHIKWLLLDIAPFLLSSLCFIAIFQKMDINFYSYERWQILIILSLMGGVILLANLFISKSIRLKFISTVKKMVAYA